MNEQHNIKMESLALLPPDIVTAIKTTDPSIAERLHHYHAEKRVETLNAIAALNPESDSFAKHYKHLVELKNAHSAAQQLWSN